MRLGKELIGKPIYSLTDGRHLGNVKDLYLDLDVVTLNGIFLGHEGLFNRKARHLHELRARLGQAVCPRRYRLEARFVGRRADRRPRLRHDRYAVQVYPSGGQSESEQRTRSDLAQRRRYRFWHRSEW